MGNICPRAVCSWGFLQVERVILLQTKRFRQDLVWYLIILQRILVYDELLLSEEATVLYCVLFAPTLSQFWLMLCDRRSWSAAEIRTHLPHGEHFVDGSISWTGRQKLRPCWAPFASPCSQSPDPAFPWKRRNAVYLLKAHGVRLLGFASSFGCCDLGQDSQQL